MRSSTLTFTFLRRIAPLLAIFILEFFLFDRCGARRFTNIYPRWNDQVQYLSESYTAYEDAQAHGLGPGLWHALTNPSLQGTLHDFFALIVFAFTGPSRSAALAINMLALIAWQAALFIAAKRRSGSDAIAFMCALLPPLLAGPWRDIPGSAYDFRLDHLAMCGLGVAAAAAWFSDGFRSRRGSTIFGVVVGLTLLTRFLTGVYFILILVTLLGWVVRGADRRRRIVNLSYAAFLAGIIAAPIFWLNRDAMHDYYWIGHYVGPESAIRNPHLGLMRSIGFVGGALVRQHLGYLFIGIVAMVALALAVWRKNEAVSPARPDWILGATFLLAPALALILHQQKSDVVVSALVPGVVLLVAMLWCQLAARISSGALRATAAACVVLALACFTHAQVPPAYLPATLAQTRIVNSIADEIFLRLRAAKTTELRVAVDYITDCFDAQVLRVIIYERHHVWLAANMTLPTSIAEPADDVVMSRLAASDFVFITEEGPPGAFPYDRKLEAMRPQIRAWCEAHLRVANQFTLFGRRMVLYQRREIPFP